MNASFIQRANVSHAMAAILLFSSANALAYSWSEIGIPSIGSSVVAGAINDRGQVIVTSADFSKAGVYRNGIYTPLPALPAGYRFGYVLGINNSSIVAGGAYSPADPTHEQGFILVGSRYKFFSQPGWNNTEARAISNSGIVTGYSYTDDQSQSAGFIYNPAMLKLADAIIAAQENEISTMKGWLAQKKLDDAKPVAQAAKATASSMDLMMQHMMMKTTGNADVDFAKGMIPHHQGAIEMANVVLKYGTDADVKNLAGGVVKSQSEEITQMKDWLSAHGD